MSSGRPNYLPASTTWDYDDDDDDDDEVEGVEMPPPDQTNLQKLTAVSGATKASSSGRLISTTLERFWQKKPQRETTPTTSASTALSEARDQPKQLHAQQLQQTLQPAVSKDTSAGDGPASGYSRQRGEPQGVTSDDENDSQDEESAVALRHPTVLATSSALKKNTGPKPSKPIGGRDYGWTSMKPSSGGISTASKPFSKRDLLRQFEDTDTDSDEVMLEGGELSDEQSARRDGSDKMDEDPFYGPPDQEDKDEDETEEDDDDSDELIGFGSRRVPVFSQDPPPQQLEISGTEEDTEDTEDSNDGDGEEEDGIQTPTKTGVSGVDVTPRRSMANPNLLQDDPDELERQEERAKQEIIQEVLNKHAEAAARSNFEIVVIMPNYQDVADYLFNPDEWEAVAIDSRWTGEDGHVTYTIVYRDGHTRVVEANAILDHVDSQVLEDFENDLFVREENPETWYYPSLRAPGGAFAGGTGITSGTTKKRGRRSQAVRYLDQCYRLGMPEEFNIPMTDSSEDDSEQDDGIEDPVQDIAGTRSPILASQYDKFDNADAEILATIKEHESDNESWDGGRKPSRGRPRGRPSTSTRAQTMIRPTRAATKRGRGRPPLIPTRGVSNPIESRSDSTLKRNVVKASATSRGRGRPRGSKNASRVDSSASSREGTPLSFFTPTKPSSGRGRPKGSKTLPKPVTPNTPNSASENSSLSEFPISIQPVLPIRPIDLSKFPPPKSTDKSSASSSPKRTLKPTRSPKPPRTPSGARGPGRPPKAPKQEDELIEQTIRTAGANVPSNSAPPSHRRTLSAASQIPLADPERPKKRRRIRFGRDGPEEVSEDDSPRRKIVQPKTLPTQSPPKKPVEKVHKAHKPHKPQKAYKSHTPVNKLDSSNEKSVFRHEVDKIINKMLLDGAPAYHVQLCSSGPVKPTIWVRVENLQSKDAKRKVKEFEAELIRREQEAKIARDRINAQLQRDRQRLAEREAQILGTRGPGRPPKVVDEEEERKEKEREEQRQTERIARRLAMQETLFAGT
ncbi:hypothetical protein TWF730_000194 [Orbilia blumenaviensis]|uniref:Uncharacterized protein n=1 Tax=Orbilia blumenaviensis TaxID=1796055 RepID=A0AAV9VN26_9PEZI